MQLASFIKQNMEAILKEWEEFASTLYTNIHPLNSRELRDHAEAMLRVIALDLETAQATQEGIDKSQGHAPELSKDTAAEVHAAGRLADGFSIEQLVAEYRALRASVIRLWGEHIDKVDLSHLQDLTRFNEAIDQSLTESITRYSQMYRDSQNLFLAILGHDVRSPLGAISMGAQLLLMDDTLPPKSVKLASRILSSTRRVNEIVRDLLDFSTSHLGDGIPIGVAPISFAAVCTQVVEEAQMLHPDRAILLTMKGDLQATWDSARISQALSNLITNAVQHGSESDPVRVNVVGADDIVLTIQNHGKVIPASKLRTIFDPAKRFAMLPTSERNLTHNLGLGLYITREIVAAHGGRIEITSTEKEGTIFTIRLPRVVSAH